MKKKFFAIFVLVSLLLGVVSCQKKPYVKGYSFNAMETTIQVQIYEKNVDEDVFKAVEEIFMFYSQLTTNFRRNEVKENSPYYNLNNVYLINQEAGIKAVKVKEELIELLELSILLHEETNGYFNIGLGKAVNLWKQQIKDHLFITKQNYLNTLNTLSTYETPDLTKIIIDKENKTVYLEDDSISLDLGAIAKGYATQLSYDYLKEEKGLKRFKIYGGGSSIALGLPPKNYPIKTFIADDNSIYEDGFLGYIPGGNKHITTSGSGQQYVNVYDDDGEIYTKIHHIISPFTLKPVNNFYKVTLVGDDSALLDAYSTVVFLMDEEEAINFLNEHNIKYLLYLNDYSIVTNFTKEEFVQYEILEK